MIGYKVPFGQVYILNSPALSLLMTLTSPHAQTITNSLAITKVKKHSKIVLPSSKRAIFPDTRKPKIDLVKAQSAIKKLSLTSVALGDYMVVLRSDIDTFICDEPYIPLMMLLNVKSGRYLTRVWSQTVIEGIVTHVDDFTEVCSRHLTFVRGGLA